MQYGLAWVTLGGKAGWRYISRARKIKRGKNKRKYEVILLSGKKTIAGTIRRWPKTFVEWDGDLTELHKFNSYKEEK